VFQVFLDFQQYVERQFGRKILTMQTDWGGEYEKLNSFFQSVGIVHHVSCPHAHQQNGSAERKHRHIVEVGLALLANASMPLKFWDDAFITATFLINMLPSKVIDFETPTEKLLQVKFNRQQIDHMKLDKYTRRLLFIAIRTLQTFSLFLFFSTPVTQNSRTQGVYIYTTQDLLDLLLHVRTLLVQLGHNFQTDSITHLALVCNMTSTRVFTRLRTS
jgi:hypothetical protein